MVSLGFAETDVANAFSVLGVSDERLSYSHVNRLVSSQYGYSERSLRHLLLHQGYSESVITSVFSRLSVNWDEEIKKCALRLYNVGCELGLYSMNSVMTVMCEDGFDEGRVYSVVPEMELDWSKCAVTCASLFISSDIEGVSKRRLYSWLSREGFIDAECEYAIEACHLDEKQEAIKSAEYLANKYRDLSKEECKTILMSETVFLRKHLRVVPVFAYSEEAAIYGVNHCRIIWKHRKGRLIHHKENRVQTDVFQTVIDFGKDRKDVLVRDVGYFRDWLMGRDVPNSAV